MADETKARRATDPEVAAMAKITAILRALDEGGRRRVVLYFHDRYCCPDPTLAA